jgi:hypothetical protein
LSEEFQGLDVAAQVVAARLAKTRLPMADGRLADPDRIGDVSGGDAGTLANPATLRGPRQVAPSLYFRREFG